ncbi:hypothetical protein ACFL54_00230 [Planctomycetota bacterium]
MAVKQQGMRETFQCHPVLTSRISFWELIMLKKNGGIENERQADLHENIIDIFVTAVGRRNITGI